MQTFITTALVALAISYLILRWLPAKLRLNLQAWLAKNYPLFSAFLPKRLSGADKSCSSSCAACGSCNEIPLKQIKADKIKPIKFVRHL
jgi:hypothetical protein